MTKWTPQGQSQVLTDGAFRLFKYQLKCHFLREAFPYLPLTLFKLLISFIICFFDFFLSSSIEILMWFLFVIVWIKHITWIDCFNVNRTLPFWDECLKPTPYLMEKTECFTLQYWEISKDVYSSLVLLFSTVPGSTHCKK